MPEASRLAGRLRRYVEGSLAGLFSAATDVALDRRLVVFNVQALEPELRPLAVHVVEVYDGDASRVWTTASTSDELRANIDGLPGFGTMKVKALGSVLFKRFGVALAEPLVPWHPTLGDVDSAAALADYHASKKANKALWEA